METLSDFSDTAADFLAIAAEKEELAELIAAANQDDAQ